MEQLLHYIWKNKLFSLSKFVTTEGKNVEIIDQGRYNTNAGPDFFNAKIRIDNTEWVGNVEIHCKASEWFLHHHDTDERYDNVILHVCAEIDTTAITSKGRQLEQIKLTIPPQIETSYQKLIEPNTQQPPCYLHAANMPKIKQRAWLCALQTERLEHKTKAIFERLDKCNSSWEQVFFVTLARNFGFGINNNAFEEWAFNVPLHAIDHHRDDLLQVEALFLGLAGLLDKSQMNEVQSQKIANDPYFTRLEQEYNYLSHKFSLSSMRASHWRFLRLRPQNFPHLRIAQLASLYHLRQIGWRAILENKDIVSIQKMFCFETSNYWQHHYTFGTHSKKTSKQLTKGSIELIIINTIVPLLFAYGKYSTKAQLCNDAIELWEQLQPEQNHIITHWKKRGFKIESAGDTQALLQLNNEYCTKKDCLRCRFGFDFLRSCTTSNNK